MILRLVVRHLRLRPFRSAVFVGAYAAGVGVMLALLSIGTVMVDQARDERWVGGGDIAVVPAGVDLSTLRMGGSVFYGIEQARFLAREILGGPRLADRVAAVAPWIDERAVYLRPVGATSPVAVRASGQIPSASEALGAAPELVSGRWTDTDADRRWLRPRPPELYREIDGFHMPPARVQGDTSWAEWHYFNLLWPDNRRWLHLSYIIAGDVAGERWRGLVLAQYRTPDGRHRDYIESLQPDQIRFEEGSPDLSMGRHQVRLEREDAVYRVRARLESPDGPLDIDLGIRPISHRYFPPTEIAASDSVVSGYVVPALRATASGQVCAGPTCVSAGDAIGYHDHNWGTWSGVTWDWGVAHPGDLDVLYGGIHGVDPAVARRYGAPFLAFVADSLGAVAALRLDSLRYTRDGPEDARGRRVPSELSWIAVQETDSLHARIGIRSAALTGAVGTGDPAMYFAQMQGTMHLSGRLGDRTIRVAGPGFFETYLR